MKPVIGITTSFETGEQRLNSAYVLAVERSGGLPVLLPVAEERSTVSELVQRIDGLIIPGGPAVVEGLIGELPADIKEPDRVRAMNDRWVLEEVLEHDLPVLGICYGMQLVNAYYGGTIYADVELQCSLAHSHSEKRGGPDHRLIPEDQTWIQHLLGTAERTVNTRHIQAVADVAGRLRVGARAPDGVIEAIESVDGHFIGVQFHAERMGVDMKPLFDHLIGLASAPD